MSITNDTEPEPVAPEWNAEALPGSIDQDSTSTLSPPTWMHCVSMFTAVTLPLAGMIAAITYAWSTGHFGWFDATILLAGMWLTGIGITVGYHRMLTHRAFDCGPKTRAALMTLGAMSMQEGPLLWCAAHRKHHAFSDREGDPHSPHLHDGTLSGILAGLWHAHLGWLFTSEMMTADSQKYVPDLLADSFACWVQRYWEAVFVPLTLGLPAMLGAGWFAFTGQPISEGLFRGFIWGGLSRIFLIHHITWSVNSICHFWGRRDFAAKDESRNNFVCALVSSGEGWHNNHHAFPTSARLGLRWWQFDNGWQVIRLLEMAGLVWDVKLPSTDAMLRKELPHSS